MRVTAGCQAHKLNNFAWSPAWWYSLLATPTSYLVSVSCFTAFTLRL